MRQSHSISRLVRKAQNQREPFVIQRFNRGSGTVNADGIYIHDKLERETISIELQPIEDSVTDGPEGQRSINEYTCYTTEEIQNKDKIEVDTGIFTVQWIEDWAVYRKFKLVRTGEKRNTVAEV